MTFAAGQKVTAADLNELIILDSGWISVTFENSWVDYGSGFEPCAYRKIGDEVFLKGLMKSGTVGASAFTLPPGYRPAASNIFAIQATEVGKRIDIGVTGAVIIAAGATNSYVSISGISFPAEV